MNLTTPQLLLAAPLVGGIGLSLISRWRRLTAVVGTVFVIILLLAMRISENEVWLVLKRPFSLTAESQSLFTLLLIGTGLLFALSLWIPAKRAFVPLAILAIAPLAAAVMVQPLTFAPLFLLLAIAIIAPIAQGEGVANDAAARYLLIGGLAVPALLIVDWMAARSLPTFSMTIVWLLLLATAVLSAAFPFIGWVRPLVREMEPLTAVYLFSIGQLGTTAVLFAFLREQAWLLNEPTFVAGLRWGGAMTALLAGLTATTRPKSSDKQIIGSLLLVNMGVSVWAFTLPVALGWETAVFMHAGRYVGLLLMGFGLDSRAGSGKLATAMFTYGALSLLGFPLTAGFLGQWHSLTAVGASSGMSWPLLIILVGMGTAVYRFISHLINQSSYKAS